ncbi:MAG: galactose oxidase-like domain-containing protein, partial [Aeromicrobium sp.]
APVRLAAAGDPAEVGEWSAPFTPHNITAVHAVLLHTGKVLILRDTDAYIWDPLTSDATEIDLVEDNFCAGQAVTDNGDVLFAGGVLDEFGHGPRWTYTFRPKTGEWTKGPDMARGRWYPSATSLHDGRILLIGGKLEEGGINDDMEVWNDGTITKVGTRSMATYPHMFLMPSGKLLVAGTGVEDSFYIRPSKGFSVHALPRLWVRGVKGRARSGTLLPGPPSGCTRVMMAGGAAQTDGGSTVEIFDTAAASPTWVRKNPLPEDRQHMNVVILPDGQLLGIGGDNEAGPTKMSLMYDQDTDVWRPLAEQSFPRAYHSTGILLPDGRVMSGGDTADDGGGSSLEVYSPPYLFKGPRPTITSAPKKVGYGQQFEVVTPDDIDRVVLMRPNAVTHTCEMNARHVELAFTPTTGGVQVTSPPSRLVAPAGYYMLFLLNELGVPSVAKWIRL